MHADHQRQFSDRYTRLVGAAAAASDSAAQPPYSEAADGSTISERLLHCVWFDQLLAPERLTTTEGVPITVLAPGFWNTEAGPDFFGAELQFGSATPVRGDVEVHVHSRDWTGHGHDRDGRYEQTILHVVLDDPASSKAVRTRSGRLIPQASLGPALADELDSLRQRIQIEDYPYASTFNTGRCFQDGLTSTEGAFWKLIRLAGEARMLAKSNGAAAEGLDWDQVCYALLLQALGYKAFARACLQLSRHVPYAHLCEVASTSMGDDADVRIAAALLGAAGLLPDAGDQDGDYVRSLHRFWIESRASRSTDSLPTAMWKAPNVRPANQPSRRIVAAGCLVAKSRTRGFARIWRDLVMQHGKPRTVWRMLERWFAVEGNDFWRVRGSVSGAVWKEPQRLLGEARARVLVVDAVIPSLLALARAEDDAALETRLYDLVASAPAQSSNAKLKLALYRTCGAPDAWPKQFRTALHAQGLLHVLGEWCIERPSCAGCGVHRVLADDTL